MDPALITTIVGAIVSHLGTFAAIVRNNANQTSRIQKVEETSASKLEVAILRTKVEEMEKTAGHLTSNVNSHLRNTSVHVDPLRDEQRWRDLIGRLDRIEGKLDHSERG
jgi:hypothetical protein